MDDFKDWSALVAFLSRNEGKPIDYYAIMELARAASHEAFSRGYKAASDTYAPKLPAAKEAE